MGGNAGGAGGVGAAGGAGGAGGCAASVDSNACHSCCVQENEAGFTTFNGAFSQCGCFGTQMCYGECALVSSLCGPDSAPKDACTTCAVSALTNGGDCENDATFMSTCEQDVACAAYLACFFTCP